MSYRHAQFSQAGPMRRTDRQTTYMTTNMRRTLIDACAANRTPLVISNSGTNGVNWSHLGFLVDDVDDDGSEETVSDFSSANMVVL